MRKMSIKCCIWVVLGFVLFIVLWFFYPHIIRRHYPSASCTNKLEAKATNVTTNQCEITNQWDQSGSQGDTYGGLTSLFTGLALLAAFVAVYYQKRQCDLTAVGEAYKAMPNVKIRIPLCYPIGYVRCMDKETYLALCMHTDITHSDTHPIMNSIFDFTVKDSDYVYCRGACNGCGSGRIEAGDVERVYQLGLVKMTRARSLLEMLINRDSSLLLDVRCSYMNMRGDSYSVTQTYNLDCPSSVTLDNCRSLLQCLTPSSEVPEVCIGANVTGFKDAISSALSGKLPIAWPTITCLPSKRPIYPRVDATNDMFNSILEECGKIQKNNGVPDFSPNASGWFWLVRKSPS